MLLLLLQLIFSPLTSSQDLTPINPANYNLPEHYNDFYILTPNNYKKRVQHGGHTWIIILTDQTKGKLSFKKNWAHYAQIHRGGLFFGVVKVKNYPEFKEFLMAKINKGKLEADQVPYENEIALIIKMGTRARITKSPKTAVKIATERDELNIKEFKPSDDAMHDFVVPAFYGKELSHPKFPILIIYDGEEGVPHVARILQNTLSFTNYFEFRVMDKLYWPKLKKMFPDIIEPEEFPNYLALMQVLKKNYIFEGHFENYSFNSCQWKRA